MEKVRDGWMDENDGWLEEKDGWMEEKQLIGEKVDRRESEFVKRFVVEGEGCVISRLAWRLVVI